MNAGTKFNVLNGQTTPELEYTVWAAVFVIGGLFG